MKVKLISQKRSNHSFVQCSQPGAAGVLFSDFLFFLTCSFYILYFVVTVWAAVYICGVDFWWFRHSKTVFAQNALLIVIFHKLEKDAFPAPTWHFDYLVRPFLYLAGVWLLIFKVSNIHVMDELTLASPQLCFSSFVVSHSTDSLFMLLFKSHIVIGHRK